MDQEHLQNLCRICLQALPKKRKECYSFDEPLDKYADTTLAEAFLSCTGHNIQENEPQHMCLPCGSELMLAFDLRVKCYQTQEVLNKLCNEEEQEEENEENTCTETTTVLQPYEDYEQIEEEEDYDVKPDVKKNEKSTKSNVIEFTIVGDKTYSCDYCPSTYSSDNALRFHLELSHSEQKCLECPNCSKLFFQATYDTHVNNCCPTETVVITEAIQEKGPKRKRTPNRKDVCPICAELRTQYHIKWHIERSQQLDPDGNVITHPYICDICGVRKTAKCYILQHIRNEHLNRFVKCRYCPAEFKHPSTLYSHERREHTDKVPLLQCKFCEFRSATHSSLRVHTYSKHTGEKKHQCDICYAKFVTKWKLQEHSACHSNETPFPCDVCNGKFKTKEGVRRHQTKVHGIYKMKRT